MAIGEAAAVIVAAGIGLVGGLSGSLVSGIQARRLGVKIQGMQEKNNRAIVALQGVVQKDIDHEAERHRFRHTIGQFTAEARLSAHLELAQLVTAAYRKKTTPDNGAGTDRDVLAEERRTAQNAAKNFYFDHRFFFSRQLGWDFKDVSENLALPWKSDAREGEKYLNRDRLEESLNVLFARIREDLLLDELAESARRAIESAPSATQGTTELVSP